MAQTRAAEGRGYLGALFFLVLVLGALAAIIIAGLRPFKNFSGDEKFILIPRGASSYQIAQLLHKEGVVRHWAWFLGYLKIAKRSSHLQAGEYRFEGPLSIPQVVDKLIRGLVYYHELTIPEGYSLFEIGELLDQKGFSKPADLWEAARHVDRVSGLGQRPPNLEGFLFPDTYHLARGATAEEIVSMMVERFRDVYTKHLETEIKMSPLNFNELLTLASLIEKETGVDEERELVSAVFHNRLKKRMPLQCDPTVIYAAKLEGGFTGKIRQCDLDAHSAYNTYYRLGLPPGPIANPGLKSIQAALKPAVANYLYFVSNNQGGHVFSVTLEEHQRAVSAYRKGLKRASNLTSSRSAKSLAYKQQLTRSSR